MNITHQNEILKQMIGWNVINKHDYETAEKSPVFEFYSWQSIKDEEVEWLMAVGVLEAGKQEKNVVRWSPFPVFRVMGKGGFQQCWHSHKEGVWKVVRYYDMVEACEEYGIENRNAGHVIADFTTSPGYKWTGQYRIFVDGKRKYMGDTDRENRISLESGLMQAWYTLSAFCCHCALPSTTVVQIKPKGGEHKPVKWHMSRTHYVLLTHMQAQRMQRDKRPITDHDITRAAHWRRAHFRRLQSSRYTYRRGLMVPIKQAWVGPKEWEGTDCKIYKVWDIQKPGGIS